MSACTSFFEFSYSYLSVASNATLEIILAEKQGHILSLLCPSSLTLVCLSFDSPGLVILFTTCVCSVFWWVTGLAGMCLAEQKNHGYFLAAIWRLDRSKGYGPYTRFA